MDFLNDKKSSNPRNKLQRWAYDKGYYSSTTFAKAVAAEGIAAYGTAFSKWHSGKAGNTSHKILMAIAKFLGANSVEDVFD